MEVCNIGMTPDHQIQEKSKLLAPYTLKRYALNNVTLEDFVEIEVLDYRHDADPEQMVTDILAVRPDLVALSYYVWNYTSMMKCAELLKQQLPEVIIMGGGPSISFIAEEAMEKNPFLDVVSFDNTRGEIVYTSFIQSFANWEV